MDICLHVKCFKAVAEVLKMWEALSFGNRCMICLYLILWNWCLNHGKICS